MKSPGGNTRKRTLTFVSEGVTDLETQKAREQVEQAKFEAECKRRERKSLREQLKANAISKQKEFNGLVKERDDVNRLSAEDLDYIKKLAEQERQKDHDLKEYLDNQSKDFASRKQQLVEAQQDKGSTFIDGSRQEGIPATRISKHLKGIVKGTKTGKKKLNLKLTPSSSKTANSKES